MAYVNGTAGTWHDLDEGNLSTRTHAGIQIVPAALAEAEARSLSGAALLEAVILAYEASARLWRATKAGSPCIRMARTVRWRPHLLSPSCAAITPAAIAAGGKHRCRRSAWPPAADTLDDGATVRNIYTGHSGRAGFQALALRDAGFTGEADAAASIMGNIYGSEFDPATATSELGRRWWIRRNYFKRFAPVVTCMALSICRGTGRSTWERDSPPARIGADRHCDLLHGGHARGSRACSTPFGCRFSLPIAMARRIAHGPADLTDDGVRAFADPVVADLAPGFRVRGAAARRPILIASRRA